MGLVARCHFILHRARNFCRQGEIAERIVKRSENDSEAYLKPQAEAFQITFLALRRSTYPTWGFLGGIPLIGGGEGASPLQNS